MQLSRYAAGIAEQLSQSEFLEAARRAFSTHGYAGATLERIAQEAGVSRVTLHRRGVTKDGLLADLVAQATEDYRGMLWPALTAEGSGAERLTQALEALCAASEEHMGLLVALRAQADGVFHEDGEEEALTRNVFTEPLERLLRDGAADGSLRATDPVEMATVLFNLVGWTYIHLRTGHGWSPERACRATLEPTLHGLLAKAPEPSR
ncbi:MAG TPA: TetR/AcrR family transcriptional regulator [Solirubrobacterales bacterium]